MKDQFNRDVTITTTDGTTSYAVHDPIDGASFTVSFPEGTPEERVFYSINSMAPSYLVPDDQ